MDPELRKFGCLEKNCVVNKWKAEKYTQMTYEELQDSPFYKTFAEDGKTGIILTMISDEVSYTVRSRGTLTKGARTPQIHVFFRS